MAEGPRNLQLPSGYDEKFVDALEEDCFCFICQLPLREPVLIRCGHRFCCACLGELFRRQRSAGDGFTCPVDRCNLRQNREAFPDKLTERKILSLFIHCPSEGCQWTGELRSKYAHLYSCPLEVISCTNANCDDTMTRNNLQAHVTTTCPWRILQCNHCGVSHPACETEAHDLECRRKPLNCPKSCGAIIPREEGTKVESLGALKEESEEDARVPKQVAELASVEGMGAGYYGRSHAGEGKTAADKTKSDDGAEGKKVIEGESRAAIVTSEGISCAFKEWAVHLIIPPDAVSERTSIVVHRWKHSSVRAPPLQEHEAITSNVIELFSMNGQELKFNTKVKLSLSHSATHLQGYELVIKKLIDRKTNNWEDVDGTVDIRCRRDFEGNHPSHMKIPDFFFPVAQADISECSAYAVVCRLKASPAYTVTSGGGSFCHPDFLGVTVTIPENALALNVKFQLELKVHEVPLANEEFEEEGRFLGPVLRIKCFDAVQFLKPVTIQLPISLREQQDLTLNPSSFDVRVLFLKSDNGRKEWIEITNDLVKPPTLDGKFVRFHVERFSAYSYYAERRNKNSRSYGQRIINFHNSLIFVQPRLAVFFAYFRPDLLKILCLMCCPAHLKGKLVKKLEKRGITPIYKNSKKDMTPWHDKVSVLVSEGICPYIKRDMEQIYLRLLEHDSDDAELEVRFRDDRDVARVEFFSIFKATAPPLCRLHLRTPTQGTDRSDLWELAQQPRALMEGCPTEDELEHLSKKVSNDWRTLGRRLTFHESELQEFDDGHKQISEKAYAMLLAWKRRSSSDATYSVLNKALCDTRVKRRDLAKKFCRY